MVDLSFHPEAQAEYESAISWYRERSPRAADRFETDVEATLERIQLDPLAYPEYDHNHRYAILTKYPFAIVYVIGERAMQIIAVAHAKRAVGYWRGREA